MWEGRATGARREIAAPAAAGLGVAELHRAAIEVVERVVPTDLTCWASLDPDTAVISTMTSGRTLVPAEYEPVPAQCEYSGAEPHAFAEPARRPEPVARLSDAPGRDVARSGRLNEVWRPLGLSHELRAVFRVDGTCWGAAGMVRRGEFSAREAEFVASVTPPWPPTRVAAGSWCGPPGWSGRTTSTRRSPSNGRPAASWWPSCAPRESFRVM